VVVLEIGSGRGVGGWTCPGASCLLNTAPVGLEVRNVRLVSDLAGLMRWFPEGVGLGDVRVHGLFLVRQAPMTEVPAHASEDPAER
jgi:hypothetical protein